MGIKSYKIERKDSNGVWETAGISDIDYVKHNPFLYALLANLNNKYNIVPLKSTKNSLQNQVDCIISLEDLVNYPWHSRFAYYEYQFEANYCVRRMNGRRPTPHDIQHLIIYDEVQYWQLVNSRDKILPLSEEFIIGIIHSHKYGEFFSEFYDNVVEYMLNLFEDDDDAHDLNDSRLVCSFDA